MKRLAFITILLTLAHTAFPQSSAVPPTFNGSFENILVGDSGKRKVALIIGISNYNSNAIRLKYADRDARIFRDYLYAVRKFPEPNLFFLPDSLATAGKIYNLIRSMMQVLKAGDELVIYFAGHGDIQTVDDFSEAFLLAWDASGSRNYKGAGGVVDIEDLQRYTDHLATRKKVQVSLIMDACHSGFDQFKDGILKTQQNIAEQFQSVNKWTGCAVNESSYEADSLKHGLFTWYLVQGLMGLADDPIDNEITPDELRKFVTGKVFQATLGQQTPQLTLAQDFRYAVTPDDRGRALAYFRNYQFNQTFAARGMQDASRLQNKTENDLIEKYNRFIRLGQLYDGDSSALGVIRETRQLDPSQNRNLEYNLKNHLAEILETRSQLVLNEFLKGKSQLPPAERFFRAGVESSLADSLLDTDDPRKKSNQVMSAFHKSYSYIKYDQFEKFNEAENLLRNAIHLEPKAAYLYVALAQLKNNRQQYDSAIIYTNKAISIIPTWTHPQNILGNQYEALYQFDKAISQFQKTIKIDSTYTWSYNNLGLAYLNMGRLSEAETYFSRSLDMKSRHQEESINRDLALSYNNIGAIFDQRKQFSKAENYYRQALSIDSTFTQSLRNLSSLYSSYNGVEAEFMLKKAISVMPYEAENYWHLADFYSNYPNRNGLLDSAAILYKKAMELDPYDPWSYIGMSNLVKNRYQPDSSLFWLQKGQTIAGHNPKMLDGLAQYFEENNKADSAAHYYQQALRINPYDFYISDNYADFLLEQKDTLTAEQILTTQSTLLYNTPDCHYQLGDFYYRIGKVEKAIQAYKHVVSIDSLYEPAWEALAYLYLEIGKAKESMDMLKKLIKLDGYTTIRSAFLHRVAELAHSYPAKEKNKWLESFKQADPNSQFFSAIRLEAAYPDQLLLHPIFLSSWTIRQRTKEYEDDWLKWMLLAAIELQDAPKMAQLARQYLNQVIITEPEVKAMALYLTGNKAEARRIKTTSDKPVVQTYGQNFRKIFQVL